MQAHVSHVAAKKKKRGWHKGLFIFLMESIALREHTQQERRCDDKTSFAEELANQ